MPEQITRLLLFFLLILLGYFVIRPALIPDSYGLYGRYRAAALVDIRDQEPLHLGRQGCIARPECHQDQGERLARGQHRAISCETCHRAAADHAADPENVHPFVPEEDQVRQFCGVCHHQRVARPASHPQIDLNEHMTPDPCIDCHYVHETEEW